jgi:hypothetical protein
MEKSHFFYFYFKSISADWTYRIYILRSVIFSFFIVVHVSAESKINGKHAIILTLISVKTIAIIYFLVS